MTVVRRLAVAVALILLTTAGTWSRAAAGDATTRGSKLPVLPAPAAGRVVATVTVTWSAATGPGPVQYVVKRDGAAVGGTCAGNVSGTSCSHSTLGPPGTYTVAVVLGNRTGPTSPPSDPA